MGAYNWILINGKCPCCDGDSLIRCQTHVASDFCGDETGRFCEREYRIGERMFWYRNDHKQYLEWKENGKIDSKDVPENIDYECCYSNCVNCNADLYVLIKFEDITPIEVIEIGIQEDWPKGFYH